MWGVGFKAMAKAILALAASQRGHRRARNLRIRRAVTNAIHNATGARIGQAAGQARSARRLVERIYKRDLITNVSAVLGSVFNASLKRLLNFSLFQQLPRYELLQTVQVFDVSVA
jgi:hypothetical protein